MTAHSSRPLLAALLVGALAATSLGQNPFQPGFRWAHGAELNTPWIPTRVDFGADGEWVWVGAEGGNPRLLLFAGAETGVPQPVLGDLSVAGSAGILGTLAGPDPRQLFTLAQYPEPDAFNRRTVVTRHDPLSAVAGGSFTPTWSYPLPFTANGPARFAISEDASVVVVAALENAPPFVRVERLDGQTGASLGFRDFPALALNALALSADGRRVALCLEQRLIIMDEFGSTLHDEVLPSTAGAMALDAAGDRLLVAQAGAMRVYDWSGAAYQLTVTQIGPANEVVTKLAIASDGSAYCASWWRAVGTDRVRHEVYEGATHTRVNHIVQEGFANGLQNAPVDAVFSADGTRVAVASWGRGDALPEVLLLELGVAQPVMEIDLPGSAMAIDLDREGTRIAVVTKNLHANQFGTTGEVRLYDTGERDLQLLSPARVGGTLALASQHAGASTALFLIGTRSASPLSVPGVLGELHLDRRRRMYIYARAADSTGRADLTIPLPNQPALIGLPLSAQAASRVAGQLVLSETVVDPVFH